MNIIHQIQQLDIIDIVKNALLQYKFKTKQKPLACQLRKYLNRHQGTWR
jgi:hypothetical protein